MKHTMSVDIDEADIFVFSQNLEKCNKLTMNINKSLKSISQTSSQSSRLFAPILSRNNMLITLQRNIESTLNSVASVKDLANEASKYEVILKKGVGKVGLKQYTQTMHRVDDMLDDIKSGNEKNAEFRGIMTHLGNLIVQSESELRDYFVSILNIIPAFDPQKNIERKIPFPYYEEEHLTELTWILDYFYNNSEGNLIESAFTQNRSAKIITCMAFLKPFVQKITDYKNAPYEQGSNGISNYTEALIGFIVSEQGLVDDLYSQYPNLKQNVLRAILTPVLNSYAKLVQVNIKSIESNIENIGFYSFELVESIQSVIRTLRFDPNLQKNDTLSSCLGQIHLLSKLLFKDAVQQISTRVGNISKIPNDNGVTEATVSSVSTLRKFGKYKQGCVKAMTGMARSEWLVVHLQDKESTFIKGSLNSGSNESLLSCFFSDCIDILVVSLDKRANKLLSETEGGSANKHKLRVGFFVLSNMTMIEEILEKSEIDSILGIQGVSRLEKLKKRYINYMVDDWRSLTVILMDSVHIDSTGKKLKDKDQIKDKFHKFNEGYDALVAKTSHYKLNSPALKRTLKAEIISLLIPMYERFWGRYKDSFKNPRKHIRYTPGELTNSINQLFK
ncbi:exocyst complex component Exo70p [Monosporozyma servazzii]